MGTLTARMFAALGARDVEEGALHPVAFDAYNQEVTGDVSKTVAARADQDTASCIAFPAEMSGTQSASTTELSPSLAVTHTTAVAIQNATRGANQNGLGIKETDVMYTLDVGSQHAVAWSIMPMNSGKDYKARQVDVAQPLMAGGPVGGNQGGDFVQSTPAVAIGIDHDYNAAVELMGPLIRGPQGSPRNAVMQSTAVALPLNTQIVTRGEALGKGTGFGLGSETDPSYTLQAAHSHAVYESSDSAVRRLTATECERLQGFPDNYTKIAWRGKISDYCPDGPRYKAMGNSMAVPVMRWIGERINAVENIKSKQEEKP